MSQPINLMNSANILQEMDAAFGSHSSSEDMEELESIQREVGLTDLVLRGGGRDSTLEKSAEVIEMERSV
jgi:hypothetical protein